MTDSTGTTNSPQPTSPILGSAAAEDTQTDAAAFHLYLDAEEAASAAGALRLLISDEAHEALIRNVARDVLSALQRRPPEGQTLVVGLSEPGIKITHTAVKLLLSDLRRDQADEQHVLRRILDKLPDEHAIRAIVLQ